MSIDASKLLQNIEVRLRGRGAVIAAGATGLTVLSWLVLRDYSLHPALSTTIAALAAAVLTVVILVSTLAPTRPEDKPTASLVQVDKLGIMIATGLTSEQDLKHMLRAYSGIGALPPPDALANGPSSKEESYEYLTSEASKALLDSIASKLDDLLGTRARGVIKGMKTSLPPGPEAPGALGGEPEHPPPLSGKGEPEAD